MFGKLNSSKKQADPDEPRYLAEMLEAELKRQGVKLPRAVLKRVRGLPPIRVVSDPEEMEQAEAVICMPDGEGQYFDDDVRTVCARCGVRIHHRPYQPKRPPKICLECAASAAEQKRADGPSQANESP
jgi:hypothetical protein